MAPQAHRSQRQWSWVDLIRVARGQPHALHQSSLRQENAGRSIRTATSSSMMRKHVSTILQLLSKTNRVQRATSSLMVPARERLKPGPTEPRTMWSIRAASMPDDGVCRRSLQRGAQRKLLSDHGSGALIILSRRRILRRCGTRDCVVTRGFHSGDRAVSMA